MSEVTVAPLEVPIVNEPSSAAVTPGSAPSSVARIRMSLLSLSLMVMVARSSLGSAVPTPLGGAVTVLRMSSAVSGPSAAPSSIAVRVCRLADVPLAIEPVSGKA